MPTRSEAEEHLRVIRSLMEKATIYRAISAEAAVIGGLLSVGVAASVWLCPSVWLLEERFPITWLAVLLVTGSVNFWLLWRNAHHRGNAWFSSGMRTAIRSLLPSFSAAAMFTGLAWTTPINLSMFWMLFYAIGLLATGHFAPRSMARLGWSFLITAFLLGVLLRLDPQWLPLRASLDNEPAIIGHLLMGCTFGLFHLIYAACTWPRKSSASRSGVEP